MIGIAGVSKTRERIRFVWLRVVVFSLLNRRRVTPLYMQEDPGRSTESRGWLIQVSASVSSFLSYNASLYNHGGLLPWALNRLRALGLYALSVKRHLLGFLGLQYR